MDFNQIRYFLALAQTLNFTRAAERCFVSQPALTQAIKRLEDELGGELITRDGRSSELTSLGQNLRGYFEQIDRTRQLVGATALAVNQGEIAELNIGLMCTVGPRLLATMLDAFQVEHPSISLVLHDVTPPSINDLLLSGGLDAVICARHGERQAQLRYIKLYEEPIGVAFGPDHEFSERDSIVLNDLINERYIDRLHCEFRNDIIDYYTRQDLSLDVVFCSEREDWIQSLIHSGLGVTVIPRYSVVSTIDFRPVADPALSRTVSLAVVDHANSSHALDELIKAIEAYDWPN